MQDNVYSAIISYQNLATHATLRQSLSENMSESALTGGKEGKGWLDFMLFKQQLLKHFMNEVFEQHPFQWDVKAKLKDIFTGPRTYRQHYKPLNDDHNVDLSFTSTWTQTTLKFADFVEDESHKETKTYIYIYIYIYIEIDTHIYVSRI